MVCQSRNFLLSASERLCPGGLGAKRLLVEGAAFVQFKSNVEFKDLLEPIRGGNFDLSNVAVCLCVVLGDASSERLISNLSWIDSLVSKCQRLYAILSLE